MSNTIQKKWNHWIKLGAARDVKTDDKNVWEIKKKNERAET